MGRGERPALRGRQRARAVRQRRAQAPRARPRARARPADTRGLTARSPGTPPRMRVVVVGASGNVGTSTLAALANDPQVESIVGVQRRIPSFSVPKTDWVSA